MSFVKIFFDACTKDDVNILLDKLNDINTLVQGETALIWAITYGYTQMALRLVELGADVNIQSESESTALIAAANNGYRDVVQALIGAGAILDTQEDEGNQTDLHWASKRNRVEIVQDLLRAGVNIDLQSHAGMGYTALMFAAWYGHIKIVDLLLQAGADLGIKNEDGETALDLAIKRGHNDIAKLIKSQLEKRTERQNQYIFDLDI